ncbi:RNA-binding protein [Histidinibacterium lentulum]|uniref:RNA-binding protein n=1 Tax=Histidinibacterium lentulum TaxID=2480588 RepID=A0A3N2R6P0_9RHOB|nr:RNA-binding protein [Histidinibacterium lentulum]ROU03077.1 RNA-binding protein [Histidinibacterium lentulum]
MSRGGRQKDREVSERRCIVTGEVRPKGDLIRFVATPDRIIVPDVLEKLPGRGIWVSADRQALEKAGQAQFSRAAKEKVSVPEGLPAEIERQLVRRVIDLIALARKAGLATVGFEKVKSWLADKPVRVLLQASDGSVRGKGKLWTPTGARYFDCLTASELGMAFGRESVIHGALCTGGLSDRVVEEAARLKGLRASGGGQGAARKDQTTT